MDYSLTELLNEVPDRVFFTDKGHPNFNAIFVEIARRIYHEETDDFTIPSHDFLTGQLPNLTTFQRSVTQERKRRAG
jgi:hypothetical protein